MKMHALLASALLLSLAGCGGSKSEATISGTDTDSLQASPAGVATLGFVDLEMIQPSDPNLSLGSLVVSPEASAEAVSVQAASSGCRTYSTQGATTTVTFNNCSAANGWTLNGTLAWTLQAGHYQVSYTLNTVDSTGKQSWGYSGTKLVTLNLSERTASLSLPVGGSPVTATYTNTLDPTRNRTYHYTPNLNVAWTAGTSPQVSLSGSYSYAQEGGVTLTAQITEPLLWTSACRLPASGRMTLTAGNATVQAVFGPDCGDVTLNGAKLSLGQ